MLEALESKPGEVFWDVGCGAGRALITAQMTQEFSKVKGVELLDSLVETA